MANARSTLRRFLHFGWRGLRRRSIHPDAPLGQLRVGFIHVALQARTRDAEEWLAGGDRSAEAEFFIAREHLFRGLIHLRIFRALIGDGALKLDRFRREFCALFLGFFKQRRALFSGCRAWIIGR